MVVGYHVIFTAYGFWLPNDPRGSWSDFVGSWELFRFGPATKTDERRSLAYDPHDYQKRLAAKKALQRPPVSFAEPQMQAIGKGFETYIKQSGLVVWACAIMPEHVHMVLGRHRFEVEKVVIQLKGRSTEQLVAEGLHPFQPQAHESGPPRKCWARGEWKVFLNDEESIVRAIQYVEDNPIKEGRPRQHWRFVVPFHSIGTTTIV